MAGKSSDQLAEAALKTMPPSQALAYLSKRYDLSKDPNYLIACIDLLGHFNDDIAFFHSALWTIKRLAHTHGATMPPKTRQRLEYKKIAIKYVRFLDAVRARIDLPEKADVGDRPKRLVVLGQQFLRPPYSITMCLLEFARLARLGGVEDVKIVITNEYPVTPASTYHNSLSAIPSTIIGEGSYAYQGDDIAVYSHKDQGLSLKAIQDIIGYLDNYAPDIVLQVGESNVVGDLYAGVRPSLCWPISQWLPHSLAPAQYYRSEKPPAALIDWTRLKRSPPVMIPQRFDLMTLIDNQNSFDRDRMRLDDDAFVFAVVGSRIEQEITTDFADLLVDVLRASPNAHIVIVGTENLAARPQLAAYSARIRLLTFTNDLRSILAHCDAFLNPPRQGGGNAAYWAMFDGLPILTLDDCDVQMTIREDAAVADLAALKTLAIAVMTEPDIHADYAEKSRRRVAGLMSDEASGAQIFDDLTKAMQVFAQRV